MEMDMTCTHEWQLASRHAVSDGILRYERCACGAWRVSRGEVGPAREPGVVDAVLEPVGRQTDRARWRRTAARFAQRTEQ